MESNTPTHSIDLTAKPLVTMSGHEGMVLRIAYIPGGQQVVTCSGDRTIRIWDAENGEQEGTSMEHEGWIEGLVITRDGKRILSGCQKNKMRVWDVETHELIEEWEHHTEGRLWCIAMSPDDQLAANGDDKGEIVIRDMNESGQIKHSIETGTVVESLCFSPNGEKLACAVNGRALEADGDRVYAIRVYDVQSGELILGPVKGHESEVIRVIWSLDGSQLFSASHDHTIRCWDSETAEPIGEPWTGHTGYIYSLSLSPDGSKLASASHDETVRFWDAHSGVPIVEYTLHHEDRLCVVTFSPSGEFVATGGYKHKVSIWRVPWWDSSQKQPHQSLLDRPAVLVPKGLSNNQQQRELDFLDLPTSRRPFISSPRPPADSAPVSAMKRVQRFWHGLVARRSSSPRQQAIEVDGVQNRRFWKSRIRAPVTEVAAGRLTDRVKVGRREPRRKKTHHKSQKSHEPQKHTSSSAGEAGPSSSHAEQSGSMSNTGPGPNSQAGPSTPSKVTSAGRASSFTQSNAGSDDSWDDMDCGEQCVDYFCFGPRENRERFRPWKKKSRVVIEAEEQAKKEKRKKNTRKHRNKKAPKTQNAVRPPHHHDPRGEQIEAASPATHDADDTRRESLGDGAVPRIVLELQEQNEQLRRRLDDSVAANQKAEVERERLVVEMTKLRSAGYDHTSSSAAEAGSFSSNAEPASNAEPSASPAQTQNIMLQPHHHDAQRDSIEAPSASHDIGDVMREPLVGDRQLDRAVPQFALQLQDQMDQLRQQVDDLVAAKRKAEAELLEMRVTESHKLQEHTRSSAGPSSLANPSGSMSDAGSSTLEAGPTTSS